MHRYSARRLDQQTPPRQNLNVLAFPSTTQAFEVRDALLKLQGQGLFELADAVVITRNRAGEVKLHPSSSAVAGCASAGASVGFLAGLAFLVPWVGTAVGAGVGAMVGRLVELGVDARFMREVAEAVKPGTSALAILGSKAQLDKLGSSLGPLLKGSTLLQTDVDLSREAEIRALLASQ